MKEECYFCKEETLCAYIGEYTEQDHGQTRVIYSNHSWCKDCFMEEYNCAVFDFSNKPDALKYWERMEEENK